MVERPLFVQVYLRRREANDTCATPVPFSSDPNSYDILEDLNVSIAIRTRTRSFKSAYSINNFVSYGHLSSMYRSLIISLDSTIVCKVVKEALSHTGWYNAMLEKIHALDEYHTWDLVDLPKVKKAVGCKWVFAVKVTPNGSMARLKARLVAKGYAQTYGVDYSDTCCHVAKLTYIRLFILLVAY